MKKAIITALIIMLLLIAVYPAKYSGTIGGLYAYNTPLLTTPILLENKYNKPVLIVVNRRNVFNTEDNSIMGVIKL